MGQAHGLQDVVCCTSCSAVGDEKDVALPRNLSVSPRKPSDDHAHPDLSQAVFGSTVATGGIGATLSQAEPLSESRHPDEKTNDTAEANKSHDCKSWLSSMELPATVHVEPVEKPAASGEPSLAGFPEVQANAKAPTPSKEPAAVSSTAEPSEVSSKENASNTERTKHKRPSVSESGLRKSDIAAKGKPFPKRPFMSRLSQEFWDKAEELFRKMDPDCSNAVTREEAMEFFAGAFNNLSTKAMFNEIDQDKSGAITGKEFMGFWAQVKASGYKEADMLAEIDELLQGGAWVDWKDGRNTTRGLTAHFPRRPWLCKLPASTWSKCQTLFERMDTDQTLVITHAKAESFFKGSFKKISADAMFNEIDLHHHGNITAKEWMVFWKQVKASGYKSKQIEEELDNLLEGGAWVDWKDGRQT